MPNISYLTVYQMIPLLPSFSFSKAEDFSMKKFLINPLLHPTPTSLKKAAETGL